MHKNILLRLPEDTLESVDNIKNLQSVTRTQLIRQSIKLYLDHFMKYENPKYLEMLDNRNNTYHQMMTGC